MARAPNHAPGKRAREADGEQVPLDLELRRVRGEPGDAEREADHEVRPDRLVRGQPDRAEQRGHPQRAEDHADRTADEPDREAEDPRGPETRLGTRPSADGTREQVDAVPGEHRGDPREEQALRHARAQRALRSPLRRRKEASSTRRRASRRGPRARAASRPTPAAAALIAMFVPAAAAGLPAASRIAGRRSVPSTSPTADPRYPAANDAAKVSASCPASRAARRGRRRRSPRARG